MASADGDNSRKYKLTVGVLLGAHLVLFWDKISGSEYVTLVIFALGLYKTANVAEQYVETKK